MREGYGVVPSITRDFILNIITQEEIFVKYTGNKVDTSKLVLSPIRDDDNPTAGYKYRQDGRLILRDFRGDFWGDCFDLVQRMTYSADFKSTMYRICLDFNIITPTGDYNKNLLKIPKDTPKPVIPTAKTELRIKRRIWQNVDVEYWKPRHFTKNSLTKGKIAPVDRIWINGRCIYSYDEVGEADPAYVYHFGTGYDYKIYFPFRRKKMRFLCNTDVIQNYDLMPPKVKILILTKSYKDSRSIVDHFYEEHDMWAIAAQGESTYYTKTQMFEFFERAEVVVSLYDFDYAGIKMANWLKREFGVTPLFFTNGKYATIDYGFKDFDEGMMKHGPTYMNKLIWKTKQTYNFLLENSTSPF